MTVPATARRAWLLVALGFLDHLIHPQLKRLKRLVDDSGLRTLIHAGSRMNCYHSPSVRRRAKRYTAALRRRDAERRQARWLIRYGREVV